MSHADCATEAVSIQDVEVEVEGREIVDSKWISNAFHADEPVISTTSRVRPPCLGLHFADDYAQQDAALFSMAALAKHMQMQKVPQRVAMPERILRPSAALILLSWLL
jgi:hypothetical protein